MDAPTRHECPCPGAKFMIGSHSRSSTANVARVYPPRMLVSLMGCKRAEGIWRMDEWVNEPYTEGETGRENAPDPREKCSCTNQINHSCRSLTRLFLSLSFFRCFFLFTHFLPCASLRPRNINCDANFGSPRTRCTNWTDFSRNYVSILAMIACYVIRVGKRADRYFG